MTTFCRHGCYWECDHSERIEVTLDAADVAERARLRPVSDADRLRALQICSDCGGSFRDAAYHSREHARMRQLGWMSHSDSLRGS